MPHLTLNSRVFVFLSAETTLIRSLGSGTLVGVVPCTSGAPCPRIQLDSGEYVRGCKVHFGAEDEEGDFFARQFPFAAVVKIPVPADIVENIPDGVVESHGFGDDLKCPPGVTLQ